MRVLVVNTGSSSLKLRLLGPDNQLDATLDLDPWHGETASRELVTFVDQIGGVGAVGHRVVHGGTGFTGATLIDDGVVKTLAALSDLAPLHQTRAVAAIEIVRELLPDVPAVACFDTAFHATLPPAAATYALPAAWRERFGLRRFGFHGLSRDVRLAAEAGDPRARLALDVYMHRLRRETAAMAAAMDGLDALVFTGGVGEHQPAVRAEAAAGLGFLGVRVDYGRNTDAQGDADITAEGAPVRTLVITAREDLEVARQVRARLASARS